MDKNLAPIKQRIIYFIDNKGIKKKDFFTNLNVAASNFRSDSLKSEINGDVIAKISSLYPDLNLDWLITGKGNMLRTEERADSSPIIELNPSAKANTYLSDIKAAAGFGAIINNPKKIDQLPAISLPNAPMGLNVAFQITGDSMHPAVRHLDYVAGNHVRDIKDIRNGYTYVLIDRDDGVLYKRLYIEGNGGSVLKIVSDNPDYPQYIREPDSIIAYFKAFCRLSSDFRTYYDDIRREIQQLKEDVAWMKGRIK